MLCVRKEVRILSFFFLIDKACTLNYYYLSSIFPSSKNYREQSGDMAMGPGRDAISFLNAFNYKDQVSCHWNNTC